MCNSRSQLQQLRAPEGCREVILGNSTRAKVNSVGTVSLDLVSGGEQPSIVLKEVLFVPNLRANLLSVTCLMEDNTDLHFDSSDMTCKLMKEGELIGQARQEGSLWKLETAEGQDILREGPYSAAANLATGKKGIDLWHLRFNHLNQDDLKKMVRTSAVKGLNLEGGEEVKGNCAGCALGKQHREKLVSVEDKRPTLPLDLVHTDLVGPLEVETYQTHKRYILTFVDDSTRRSWIYLLATKDEVFKWFKQWRAMVEKQSSKQVKILRSDGGGEYISKEMRSHLAEEGIVQEFTMPYTPQQNGVAERFNRTLVEGVRAMLQSSGMPKGFWGEAALCFNHTHNRSPTTSLKNDVTPLEAWSGVKPSVYHLRAFGCKVSVHIPEQKRKKLDPKSYPGIFLGYSLEKKGYRVWNNQRIAVEDSRDVIFYEEFLRKRNLDHSPLKLLGDVGGHEEIITGQKDLRSSVEAPPEVETSPEGTQPLEEEVELDMPEVADVSSSETKEQEGDQQVVDPQLRSGEQEEKGNTDPILEIPQVLRIQQEEVQSPKVPPLETLPAESEAKEQEIFPEPDEEEEQVEITQESEAESETKGEFQLRRGTRNRQQPQRLAYEKLGIPTAQVAEEEPAEASHACCFHAVNTEPQDYRQAMASGENALWKEAISAELNSLKKNDTYRYVELPRGKKALKNKWVFKVKTKLDGSKKYKARLVIKGFLQKEGVDYSETFAPVVKYKSLRLLLGIANQRNMEVHQMDVTTAFLYGDLDEEIYMAPPEGIIVEKENTGKVWKLERSLYGLKQAPRCWNKKIHQFLESLGFRRNISDYATYSRGLGADQVILALYVDDLLIMSENLQEVLKVKAALSKQFEMVDFGEVSIVLGMRVTRDRRAGTLQIDQETYAGEILARFNMQECKPVSTPLTTDQKLSKKQGAFTEQEKRSMEVVPYRQVVGSLMYLMVCTRPDIASAVGILARYMQDPGKTHWEAAKRVLRYVQHTKKLGLHYGRRPSLEVVGFCDSDWGGDPDEKKSTTGYVFLVGGGAFSWCSKRQGAVSLSSCEAEYYASSQAAMEVAWQRSFLEEIGMQVQEAIIVGSDSQSALNLIGNPVYHEKSKHIGIRFHYIREQVQQKLVEFVYVPTEFQVADSLTKAVPREKLEYCRKKMGVSEISNARKAIPRKKMEEFPEEEEDFC